jgi:hypothetical protein
MQNTLVAFLSCIAFLPISAHSGAMEICKEASEQANKLLPLKKDNVTVVRETGCFPGSPKIKFVYILEINVPIDSTRQLNFSKEIKPNVKNSFCSDPDIRSTLNLFDIDHRYYTKDGFFAGSFLIQSSECK